MAKTKLPDPLGRRHLIERELAPAQAIKYAEAYLEEGRHLEAVDFFAKAEATEPLAKLRRDAVSAGDVFLLKIVATATGDFPGSEEWHEVARAAAAVGKERYAEEARRLADVGED